MAALREVRHLSPPRGVLDSPGQNIYIDVDIEVDLGECGMMAMRSNGRSRLGTGRMRIPKILVAVATVVGAGAAVAVTAEAPASAAGSPITIAMVCSCTGPAGPEYQGAQGVFLARIAQQNAAGGINGHKISTVIIDDQTNPSLDQTAVQSAVSKGVTGIVAVSALFYEGAKYANQAGIPVTGASSDGPEWGTQPYTNMFASDTGSLNPKYPVNTQLGKFIVTHGGTVIGSYGYGVSPSSTRSATATVQSVVHAGGKEGVLDTSVPFGGVEFTPAALAAQSSHVNAIYAGLDDNSNFALVTAMKQAGVKLKAVVFPTGYEPGAIKSPVWKYLQGAYFDTGFRPFQLPNAGTENMKAALVKYDHFTSSQFPTFIQYEAWMGADLMIKGMQNAGTHLTPSGVTKALRSIKSYNGNGLLGITINYSTAFGHDPAQNCGWFVQAKTNGYVPVSSQTFCGTDIPGTATASGT